MDDPFGKTTIVNVWLRGINFQIRMPNGWGVDWVLNAIIFWRNSPGLINEPIARSLEFQPAACRHNNFT